MNAIFEVLCLQMWSEWSKMKVNSVERYISILKLRLFVKANKLHNIFLETDNQLQIHTPKLPTAGFSPPSASSDVSSSAKKTSAKKRSSSEILGTHMSCRITIYITPSPFQ